MSRAYTMHSMTEYIIKNVLPCQTRAMKFSWLLQGNHLRNMEYRLLAAANNQKVVTREFHSFVRLCFKKLWMLMLMYITFMTQRCSNMRQNFQRLAKLLYLTVMRMYRRRFWINRGFLNFQESLSLVCCMI